MTVAITIMIIITATTRSMNGRPVMLKLKWKSTEGDSEGVDDCDVISDGDGEDRIWNVSRLLVQSLKYVS